MVSITARLRGSTVSSDAADAGTAQEGGAGKIAADKNEAPMKPLTSLNWPYVPEESAFPDPLKRDDPKPLQLPQYEAIGIPSSLKL